MCCLVLHVLDFIYWTYIVCVLRFASFPQHYAFRFIHVAVCKVTLAASCMSLPQFIHFVIGRVVSFSQCFACMNTAAMNILNMFSDAHVQELC